MANDHQVTLLKSGSQKWNQWRKDNPKETPDLEDADFSRIDLVDANLVRANLQGAKFDGANLFGVKFCEANLQRADFGKPTSRLLASQLAGADLTASILPEELRIDNRLAVAKDISSSAKNLFFALLAGCLYSGLTIITTHDADLITNRISSPLPIIQTPIPIVRFYEVAPLILLCIYFYFHFYLQKLWEELALLPAVLPDGRSLDACTDPWLLNDLVRHHFAKLQDRRPLLSRAEEWVSILLAWWLVPLALYLFWSRYLPRHDLIRTIPHAAILAFSGFSAWSLHHLAVRTLRTHNKLGSSESKKGPWFSSYYKHASAIILIGLMILISIGVIKGKRVWDPTLSHPYSANTWLPWLVTKCGHNPFASLNGADISGKPQNHNASDSKYQDISGVHEIKLDNIDLRYAAASEAFLAKSHMQGAKLRGAHLDNADLRQTYLESADLSHTELLHAHLQGSDLRNADLSDAKLGDADLTEADMVDANLSHAILYQTKLVGTKLRGANLLEVTFDQTDIKYADLINAKKLSALDIKMHCKNWDMAFFSDEIVEQLKLKPSHNEALKEYRNSGSNESFTSWQETYDKQHSNPANPPQTAGN